MTFVSVVVVTQDNTDVIHQSLLDLRDYLIGAECEWELLVIDNASRDDTLDRLRAIVESEELANTQILALATEVDRNEATWLGFESAIGDFVVSVNPLQARFDYLDEVIALGVSGSDIVFALNHESASLTRKYRLARRIFLAVYKKATGFELSESSPDSRLLSRKLINFLLQHTKPSQTFRHLPTFAGFMKREISFRSSMRGSERRKSVISELSYGIQLLVSNTKGPLRIATALSLFGAFANILYSAYVVYVGTTQVGVAPGWVSLSLQQAGMFFLLSVALFVFGEYLLHVADIGNSGRSLFVASEISSKYFGRQSKLNIDESSTVSGSE
jgi:glycosyltransferase involved in cell wall biosynthesis